MRSWIHEIGRFVGLVDDGSRAVPAEDLELLQYYGAQLDAAVDRHAEGISFEALPDFYQDMERLTGRLEKLLRALPASHSEGGLDYLHRCRAAFAAGEAFLMLQPELDRLEQGLVPAERRAVVGALQAKLDIVEGLLADIDAPEALREFWSDRLALLRVVGDDGLGMLEERQWVLSQRCRWALDALRHKLDRFRRAQSSQAAETDRRELEACLANVKAMAGGLFLTNHEDSGDLSRKLLFVEATLQALRLRQTPAA